jgi:hypothetical protein
MRKGLHALLTGGLYVFVNNISEFILIYLLTAIGLIPGGSSTVHIYTTTVHRTTKNKQYGTSYSGSKKD